MQMKFDDTLCSCWPYRRQKFADELRITTDSNDCDGTMTDITLAIPFTCIGTNLSHDYLIDGKESRR